MILLALKQFFKKRTDASVMDVANAFNIQASAAQGMIDYWVKKKCLIACSKSCDKGTCGGCPVSLSRYKWVSN